MSLGVSEDGPSSAPLGGKTEPVYIVVRATIHLPRLPRGREAFVDVTDPQIRDCLLAGWIVPVGSDDELPAGA